MICTAATRTPLAALSGRRTAPLHPSTSPAAPPYPRALSILSRAHKDDKPQQQSSSDVPVAKAEEGQKTGAELSTAQQRGGDIMDIAPALMPPPFRQVAIGRMADHMLQMQREMDSLMGAFGMPSPLSLADPFDIFDRAATAPLLARRALAPAARGLLSRPVALEVDEDAEGYTVTAEVPGFDKNEIKISISEDGILTMTGSHEETTVATEAQQQKLEKGDVAAKTPEQAAAGAGKAEGGLPRGGARRYASFVRSVALPDDVDQERVTATTQHGVLTVRIPKSPKPAPKVREIPVA
ncbi:hypothetical protein GPECTOR_22g903 [Gonium pectorale]|uniref:SHSP domain-containing protein n=1 Tax=Gonium pectorale TaxID=33097 RepID=A0A150GHN5_GONPE|nr:hypothetical protein GPECTOR_22g903 [Gonium pectorale]|eukprot:KXZ49309.1 hypothetical protein GPECTOR_22g903 [Gonium pectorale]